MLSLSTLQLKILTESLIEIQILDFEIVQSWVKIFSFLEEINKNVIINTLKL